MMAPCRAANGGADRLSRPATTRSTSAPAPHLSVSIPGARDELAPPRLSAASPASPAEIPRLRSCRAGPGASPGAGVNPSAPGFNGSLVAAGALAFGELRLRRSRTVSGNSTASTSSSSSHSSSYVPTTGSSAGFPLPSAVPGTTLRGRAFSQDVDDEDEDADMDADADADAPGSGCRPSDEFLDALQHVAAPALPPAPYPVDPYHFYCKRSARAAQVAAAVAERLAASDVESSFLPHKCKFRCVKYVHYSHVEFVVRVFAHADALLVECQRRAGSVLLWDGLYHSLYHQLAHLVDLAAPACPQSGAQKRVAPATALDDDRSLGVQIWQTLTAEPRAAGAPSSGVEAMKLMLTSKFVDAQREGCAALAVLTESAQNAALVARLELVEPLTRASEARDADMARSATGALANMARALPALPAAGDRGEDLRAAVRRHLQRAADIVLTRLEQRSGQDWSLYALELLRESARACAAFVSAGVVSDASELARAAQVLQRYAAHRDRQLAVLCRAAMEQLDARTRAGS